MTAVVVFAAALFAAAAILLAASVWRDASRRFDHALAILDDPDQEDTMPDLAPRCGYRWQHAIGHAGHLDLACDLPAGHHPKMHSAPNPDLPRLYYVDPDVAPEVVDSGQCYHEGDRSLS